MVGRTLHLKLVIANVRYAPRFPSQNLNFDCFTINLEVTSEWAYLHIKNYLFLSS